MCHGSASTCHVANDRPSIDSPHQGLVSHPTAEYQYLCFKIYRASNFTAWRSMQDCCHHPARRWLQTWLPSASLQRWRQASLLPPPLPLPPLRSLSPTMMIICTMGTTSMIVCMIGTTTFTYFSLCPSLFLTLLKPPHQHQSKLNRFDLHLPTTSMF